MTAEQIRNVVELYSGKDFLKINPETGYYTRKRELKELRQLWTYLAFNYGKNEVYFDDDVSFKPYSLVEIADMLGQTHATVINSCKRVKDLLDVDPVFKKLHMKCLKEIEFRNDELNNLAEMNGIERIEYTKNREIYELKKEHQIELERTRNAIKDKFISELLTLPYVFREEFLQTRFKPYLKLIESRRRNYKNIRDIEVVC